MLFVHIPKTGGHAVWEVVKANGGYRMKDERSHIRMHTSANALKQRLGPEYNQFKKVSLIRNPWERAVSLYFGRNKLKKFSPEGFAKYMRQWRTLGKMRWNPYYQQTALLNRDVLVFRLDQIEKLWHWMEMNLDITVDDPGIIKTGKNRYVERMHYRKYFNKELRAVIAQAHKRDIERFGWKY